MSKTLVINDLHLGVQRTGGTTLASATALREYGHNKHRELLELAVKHGCSRILVNGDLTDVYDTPLMQALEIYEAVNEFLEANPQIQIIWAVGNHDLSKDSSRLGTVAFVGALLQMRHPTFTLIDKPAGVAGLPDTYVIPHVPNQDLFDLELSRIPEATKWLMLHCNFDNKFACAADHSLDLSRDQAKELKARGITMVLGHEHQGREILKGSVLIVGNQFPTSISDCLAHGDAQKDGTKRALIIDHDAGTHEFIQTWTADDADGWFARVDWRELKEVEEEGRGFIRVEGDALGSEAADVIKTISAFRQRSQSFVVTNAVKVEQAEALDDLSESIEDIRSRNVVDMLLEILEPAQREVVRSLLDLKEPA